MGKKGAELEGESTRPSSHQKKKATRGPTSGKSSTALYPQMDPETHLAITTALGHVDQEAKRSTFYDPTAEETRKAEDVGQALSMLRSWMRLEVSDCQHPACSAIYGLHHRCSP